MMPTSKGRRLGKQVFYSEGEDNTCYSNSLSSITNLRINQFSYVVSFMIQLIMSDRMCINAHAHTYTYDHLPIITTCTFCSNHLYMHTQLVSIGYYT